MDNKELEKVLRKRTEIIRFNDKYSFEIIIRNDGNLNCLQLRAEVGCFQIEHVYMFYFDDCFEEEEEYFNYDLAEYIMDDIVKRFIEKVQNEVDTESSYSRALMLDALKEYGELIRL